MCSVVFLASFQNSLLFLDYQINRSFYEKYCINASNPDLECHGKCQVAKKATQPSAPTPLLKISFEFNFIPHDFVYLEEYLSFEAFRINKHFLSSPDKIADGYLKKVLQPPQI